MDPILQQILQQLANIQQWILNVNTNERKIDDLPNKPTLDESNLLHISDGGTSKKLAISVIFDALNEPNTQYIQIDGRPFRYVVGIGNDGASVEIGDIAAGGCFQFSGNNFFGDLLCIDNTGDITTGIGTKWQPLDPSQIP